MDTYPRTWSSTSGMTCYRIVEFDGDPDSRAIQWCRGEGGVPSGPWRRLDDNVAACYEILRLAEEVERLKAEKQEVLSIFMKGPDVLLAAERARIRRELLGAIDDLRVEAGSVKGDELRLWIVPSHLVAALDRIVPEEG